MKPRLSRFPVFGLLLWLALLRTAWSAGSDPPKRPFDLARGDAAVTLRQFSRQSGEHLIFPVEAVRGVQTNPVTGRFAPREALDLLLHNTGLVAVRDEKTGAMAVRRHTPAAAPRASPPGKPSAASDPARPKNTNMKKHSLLTRAAAWLAVVTASVTDAQTASTTPASAAGDQPIQLSVFEVTTDKDVGYQSTATLSGTRTGELLRNLPVAVSVLNQEFLRDIAVTDSMQAMVLYGIGSEQQGTPGIGLNGIGGGGNAVNFRGILSSWQGRDGFIWYAVSDNYSVESIELTRGPNGNVFGDSRAGGLPNIVSKRARLRDFGEVALRWDSEGSTRGTADLNKKLGDKLGLRLNLMKQDARDWRDTNYDKREGAALAVQYDFTRNTRVSLVGEYNNVGRVPSEGLRTDLFTSGYVLGSGTVAPGTVPSGTAVIQPAGATQRWTYIAGQPFNLISTPAATFRHTNVGTNQTVVAQSIVPRHVQWNGPSDRLDHDSLTVTGSFEHRFNPNTIVQAAYNLTLSDRLDYRANPDGIRRDVNPSLPGSGDTLVANPNFDQLYVDHRWTQTHFFNRTASYRITGVHDADFGFTKQRIILNGSLRDDRFRLFQRQELLTPQAISARGLSGAAAVPTNNVVRRRHYLRDGNDGPLRHLDSADYGFYETTGGQKTRAFFYSGSALLLGRYWKDRILSTVGVRRDDFESRQVRVVADPVTNLGRLETGGSGEEIWREQIGQWRTSWNYGLVVSPMRQWRVFANYAENFQQNGTVPYFNGDARQPRVGDGYDYGASVYLWQDRLTATITRFDNKANNENLTAISNQLIADEINRLLGTGFSTAFPQDTQARRAQGTELELIANLTRQWTLAFRYSMRKNVNTDFAPRLSAALAAMKARTSDSSQYVLTETRLSELINENPSARMGWNFSTRYSFTEGRLRGARIGAYGYYRQGNIVTAAGRPDLVFDSYLMLNAFVGYEWKLTPKYRTDLQLNVENLTNQRTRIGSGFTGYSYLAPTKFIVQSTLRY